MENIPRSLVQIHYHNRTGGVREVMAHYADAFNKISKTGASNALICSSKGSIKEDFTDTFIDIAECDYHTFKDAASFYRLRDVLVGKLRKELEGVNSPVAVVCHNLALGKNPALSSALRLIASEADSRIWRFFWVIHDFAEEGRFELLSSIQLLHGLGIDIYNDLYATGAPVHFVVPGSRGYELLKNAGFAVTELSNPLKRFNIPDTANFKELSMIKMGEVASIDGTGFDPSRRLFCYPSRVIHRKNFLEALGLISIVLGDNLITGAPGYTSDDKKRDDSYLRFANHYGLNVVFNPGRISWDEMTGNKEKKTNYVSYLYAVSDCAVTTSVAEGFGYGMYEPWLYGRSLIGRRPAGFLYPCEMISPPSLYSYLPVPAAWVPLDILIKGCVRRIYQCTGRELKEADLMKELVIEETIDFGVLDDAFQLNVLKNVVENSGLKTLWTQLLQKKLPGWPGLDIIGSISNSVVNENETVLNECFSEQKFIERFKECLSIIPEVVPGWEGYHSFLLNLLKGGVRLLSVSLIDHRSEMPELS
jgi:hypothetical protein